MSYGRHAVISQQSLSQLCQTMKEVPLDYSAMDVATIQGLVQQISELVRTTYDYIAGQEGKLTFSKVVQPFIDMHIAIRRAKRSCELMMHVHPDENARKTGTEAVEAFAKLSIENTQRRDAYEVFQRYENAFYSSESKKLDDQQKRLFKKLMNEYKRDGMHIQDALLQKEIVDIKKQLSELSTLFQNNVSEWVAAYSVEMIKSQLEGLPESWFTAERQVTPGVYKVTVTYPDVFPIMNFAKNREVRKQIYTAFRTRAIEKNPDVLSRVIQLRQRHAEILGYTSHADYMAEIRMTKTKQNIKSFLDQMRARFTPASDASLAALRDFASKMENDPHFVLQNYDIAYYTQAKNALEYNVNTKEVDEHFPLKKVIDGTLSIYEKLLGVMFVENKTTKNWHEDVKHFEVYDFDHEAGMPGQKRGEFFLDLHPRDGKYTHAMAFDINPGIDPKDGVVAMVCNLPKETSLSFSNDVNTFFHEFGHVMHYLLARQKIASLDAYNTEIDFVEAPSQMLENWCYDHRVLEIISAHPETGKPLSKEIADKLLAMKTSTESPEVMRQLVLSSFDMAIHSVSTAEEAGNIDIKALWQHLQRSIQHIEPVPEECFAAAFAHMVADYDVGYYGYMMSNTYAQDMFDSKFKANPLDPAVGADYRKFVLEPAATLDGIDILKNFLGREPRIDAYLASFGLKTDAKEEKEIKRSPYFFRERKKVCHQEPIENIDMKQPKRIKVLR